MSCEKAFVMVDVSAPKNRDYWKLAITFIVTLFYLRLRNSQTYEKVIR